MQIQFNILVLRVYGTLNPNECTLLKEISFDETLFAEFESYDLEIATSSSFNQLDRKNSTPSLDKSEKHLNKSEIDTEISDLGWLVSICPDDKLLPKNVTSTKRKIEELHPSKDKRVKLIQENDVTLGSPVNQDNIEIPNSIDSSKNNHNSHEQYLIESEDICSQNPHLVNLLTPHTTSSPIKTCDTKRYDLTEASTSKDSGIIKECSQYESHLSIKNDLKQATSMLQTTLNENNLPHNINEPENSEVSLNRTIYTYETVFGNLLNTYNMFIFNIIDESNSEKESSFQSYLERSLFDNTSERKVFMKNKKIIYYLCSLKTSDFLSVKTRLNPSKLSYWGCNIVVNDLESIDLKKCPVQPIRNTVFDYKTYISLKHEFKSTKGKSKLFIIQFNRNGYVDLPNIIKNCIYPHSQHPIHEIILLENNQLSKNINLINEYELDKEEKYLLLKHISDLNTLYIPCYFKYIDPTECKFQNLITPSLSGPLTSLNSTILQAERSKIINTWIILEDSATIDIYTYEYVSSENIRSFTTIEIKKIQVSNDPIISKFLTENIDRDIPKISDLLYTPQIEHYFYHNKESISYVYLFMDEKCIKISHAKRVRASFFDKINNLKYLYMRILFEIRKKERYMFVYIPLCYFSTNNSRPILIDVMIDDFFVHSQNLKKHLRYKPTNVQFFLKQLNMISARSHVCKLNVIILYNNLVNVDIYCLRNILVYLCPSIHIPSNYKYLYDFLFSKREYHKIYRLYLHDNPTIFKQFSIYSKDKRCNFSILMLDDKVEITDKKHNMSYRFNILHDTIETSLTNRYISSENILEVIMNVVEFEAMKLLSNVLLHILHFKSYQKIINGRKLFVNEEFYTIDFSQDMC